MKTLPEKVFINKVLTVRFVQIMIYNSISFFYVNDRCFQLFVVILFTILTIVFLCK